MALTVTSPAFREGDPIPGLHTCDGRDVSPALEWRGQPAATRSLAVICDDPDASSGAFAHWVLYDLPSSATRLGEGAHGAGKEGVNNFRKRGYSGPCPPPGKPHRYRFHVYALDVESLGAAGLSRQDALAAMQGHILAEGQLMGTYARRRG